MYSSEETKQSLARQIGIPYEELIAMDDDEMQKFVETKTGKQFGWKEGIKVKGISIVSIQQEERKRLEEMRKRARRL